MTGKAIVVVGGQYGSEAKGTIAGLLVATGRAETVAVRVAGPNAGHTVYDARTGVPWAFRQLPVAAVVREDVPLVIAAGSEIDPGVLDREVAEVEAAGWPVRNRLFVDRSATLIESVHKEREMGLVGAVGSTGKGIGAARADRIMRAARLAREAYGGVDTGRELRRYLRLGWDVLIEGTQGYGLGLHGEHYPQCTSSDCRSSDFLAMAGVSPEFEVETWVVARTYPIRVAGNSGWMKGETSWEALGQEPERTTVTQKIRRVGAWDAELVASAVEANGGEHARLALTMLDYVFPELQGASKPDALESHHWGWLQDRRREIGIAPEILGTSPTTQIDLRRFAW